MEITRIFEILLHYEERHPEQKVALSCKRDGKWIAYSPKEYLETAQTLSYALIHKGIQIGDKVGVISTNRPEWSITQMAVTQIGAILVPIYPTISAEDYHYILNHSEVKLLLMEGADVMNKIQQVNDDVPYLKDLYTFIDRKNFPYWDQLIEIGRQNPNPEELKRRRDAVSEQDCAMMIYTSGTTGTPKGVMLSHYNLMKQIEGLRDTPAKWSNKALSFLPLCHAYENILVLLYQYLGMSVYYVSNLATIADSIKEVHPTMMSSVPRVMEKFYDKIVASGKTKPWFQRQIFMWAVRLGKKYTIEDSERSAWCNFKHKIADKLVYSKIRAGLGGNFDIVVSGAASLQPQLCSFFSAIGLPIFEGYGLTETSPVVAVASRAKYSREPKTVGFPLPGVEVAITPEGEVICRGTNVMLGYYKDEALTREVIDKDGWFHTGDLGRFTKKGQLMLTGRKKNIFKTSFGKYVNPQMIEDKLVTSNFIEQVVVVGENRKFAAALIVPDFNFLKCWCTRHKLEFTTPEKMITNPDVIKRFKTEIDKYNVELGKTENVVKFVLLADEWSQETGFLTPTLKIKRNVILQHYEQTINKIYDPK